MNEQLANVLTELATEAIRLAALVRAGKVPAIVAARAAVEADSALASLRSLTLAFDHGAAAKR